MRVLRLLLAALIAATVLVAGFFAAAAIIIAGLVGYLVQLVFGRPRGVRSRPASVPTDRSPGMRSDDVIDVVATEVRSDPTQDKLG